MLILADLYFIVCIDIDCKAYCKMTSCRAVQVNTLAFYIYYYFSKGLEY